MDILQMTELELYDYLQKAAMENPVIEIREVFASKENPDFISCLQKRSLEEYQCTSASDESNRRMYEQEQEGENLMDWRFQKSRQSVTLFDALWEQLVSIPFRPKDAATLKYMLASLDSWGYLREPLEQIGKKMDQPPKRMKQILSVVQSLDPPGIGARTISECLLLQIKRQMECPKELEFIVTDCLDLLAGNQIPALAKKAGISTKEASRLCQIVKSLNPKPGAVFSSESYSQYMQPDVSVEQKNGIYQVQLNDSLYPQISITPYYLQLEKTTEEEEVKIYLTEKIRQAEEIQASIKQRRETLFRISSAIVSHQKDFWEQGSSALKPLKFSELAGELHLSEVTINRTICDKYLRCSQGTFPFIYFFPAKLAGAE